MSDAQHAGNQLELAAVSGENGRRQGVNIERKRRDKDQPFHSPGGIILRLGQVEYDQGSHRNEEHRERERRGNARPRYVEEQGQQGEKLGNVSSR